MQLFSKSKPKLRKKILTSFLLLATINLLVIPSLFY